MGERGRRPGFDRAKALEQAMRVFWRKTYEGASLVDLTKAMRINPPSLYAAFGSKEALFREAVAHYAKHQGVDMWRALDEAPSAREAIELFLSRAAHVYSTPGNPPGCLTVLGAQHGLDEGNAAHIVLRAQRRANLAKIRDRLARAVSEHELPADFAIGDAAAFYFSVQSGMSILARDGADRATLEGVAREALLGWSRWSGTVTSREESP